MGDKIEKYWCFILMMPFFQSELGWSVLGSLGRTQIDAGQVHRLCVVGPGV